MREYLEKNFTEGEVERIIKLIHLYGVLFPHGTFPGRIQSLKDRAAMCSSEFSRKLEQKMKSSKKYGAEFEKAFVAYGHTML